jgi:hypothetical protein
MNTSPLQERLRFLARVIRKEIMHLSRTDIRLFTTALKPEDVRELESNEELAERIEAFVGRFGRLQDTLGDKMLPNLLTVLGERPASMIDNLDRAERLGWIASADAWLELRKRRNQMVHEYIEDPGTLSDALNAGHSAIPVLLNAAEHMLAELDRYFARSAAKG